MRERRKACPQLERLESMTLLSGVAAPLHHHQQAEVATTTPTPSSPLTLSGTERGVFHVHRSSSEKTYDISASGTLTPIGLTSTTGNLVLISGISSGPPSGTLHLTTSQGTLTLQIPKSVAIPAGLPTPTSRNEIVDTYTITQGTGAYSGDTGAGVVEFTFHPTISSRSGRVSITFTSLPAGPLSTL